MKKKTISFIRFFSLFFIGIIIFFTSCQNDNDSQPQANKDDNFVTEKQAIEIAQNLTLNNANSSIFSKGAREKKIDNLFQMQTKSKKTAFYIVNYENAGFVIISADKRNTPILAYSDNSTFQNDSINYPEGLKLWLSMQTNNIESIRSKNILLSKSMQTEWKNINKKSEINLTGKIMPTDPTSCPESTSEVVGPLLTTKWGQGYGYNSLVPLDCSSNYGGKAPTGCVATAMAQIMKYYQKPSSYNWANMPSDFGTTDTAILMRDIGYQVNMNYGCGSSGANSEEQISSSFRNDFHYANASDSDYNYQTVVSQVRARRPVILTGGRKKDGISFNMYTDGHAWVCDGFISSTSYTYDETRGSCYGVGMLSLHMNWGWNGSYNGWFSFNNFNPGNDTYNYKTRMYYNIIP